MMIEGLKKEIQRRLLRELYMLFLDGRTGRYQRQGNRDYKPHRREGVNQLGVILRQMYPPSAYCADNET